jgi:hypothetical protein
MRSRRHDIIPCFDHAANLQLLIDLVLRLGSRYKSAKTNLRRTRTALIIPQLGMPFRGLWQMMAFKAYTRASMVHLSVSHPQILLTSTGTQWPDPSILSQTKHPARRRPWPWNLP